jgi:hypothetical protein
MALNDAQLVEAGEHVAGVDDHGTLGMHDDRVAVHLGYGWVVLDERTDVFGAPRGVAGTRALFFTAAAFSPGVPPASGIR